MKIIVDREDIQAAVDSLRKGGANDFYGGILVLEDILINHPHKTDGILGVEIDEWPKYAPEDYENINRKMIVHILVMLSKIHYEWGFSDITAKAQTLLNQLAEQPHEK